MSLPYRWHPLGAKYATRPGPGTLVAYEHAVWRVVEASERPGDERHPGGIWVVALRPLTATVTDGRNLDRHIGKSVYRGWDTYPDEHYPVCATCGDVLPCREQMTEKVSTEAARRVKRFEVPGVCPACSEPVTARQKSVTYEENVVAFLGPPVTFHRRGKCFSSILDYDRRWAAETGKRARWSCDGRVVVHGSDYYECTEGALCAGPHAQHAMRHNCDCHDGSRGVYPTPRSQQVWQDGLPELVQWADR